MSILPFSSTQIDRLSERICASDRVSDDDLGRLHGLLVAHDTSLQEVAASVREFGLEPTTRLKTTGTIIDKLRRERPITLRGIRDLAGARIVQRMTLDEQDAMRDRILEVWPEAKVIDRRANPNNGYRALHVVPRVNGCQVEIQVRTYYQDTWAQTMEWFADRWGRQIRYGHPPLDPDESVSDELTRGELVRTWIDASGLVAELEKLENRRSRVLNVLTAEEVDAMDQEIDARFGTLRTILRDLRETFN